MFECLVLSAFEVTEATKQKRLLHLRDFNTQFLLIVLG